MATDEKGGNLDEKKRLLIKQKLGGGKFQMQYLKLYLSWFYFTMEYYFRNVINHESKQILDVILFYEIDYMPSKYEIIYYIYLIFQNY